VIWHVVVSCCYLLIPIKIIKVIVVDHDLGITIWIMCILVIVGVWLIIVYLSDKGAHLVFYERAYLIHASVPAIILTYEGTQLTLINVISTFILEIILVIQDFVQVSLAETVFGGTRHHFGILVNFVGLWLEPSFRIIEGWDETTVGTECPRHLPFILYKALEPVRESIFINLIRLAIHL
jgi:hypothetical protein